MSPFLRVLIFLSCAWSATSAAAAPAPESLYRFAPAPAWVLPATVDYAAKNTGEAPGGAWNLAYDRQANVTEVGDSAYVRVVTRITSTAGVQSNSTVNLYVDPSYQTLSIHSLSTIRNGSAIDLAARARITALPVETQLEARTYRGTYQINIVLPDVRVDDVVDIAYSIDSEEHLFPGHYSSVAYAEFNEPVHWTRVRYRYPAARKLTFRANKPGFQPAFSESGGIREATLVVKDSKGLLADAHKPAWYEPWGYVEVSDFGTWAEVSGRTEGLFRLKPAARPLLDALVREFRAARATTNEQRILSALQYVQENIRYTSIALGRGTHEPTDPEIVLERRFGDCKDKALLLVSMLRGLGFEATPALVNTFRGRVLPDSLPSVYAFDHVIVRAVLGARVYWLDPTNTKQLSPLSALAPPDFQKALVIAPGTAELETIPRPAPDSSAVESFVEFDLRNGEFQPATMKVDLRFTAGEADAMRAELAQGNLAARQASYANYFARRYPGLRADGELKVDDDSVNNVVVIHARFVIDVPFAPTTDKRWRFISHADALYSQLEPLNSMARTSPIAIPFPEQLHQRITLLLPSGWKLGGEEPVKVEDPAFTFSSTVTVAFNKLQLDYRYTALADHVDLADLARFTASLKKVDNDTEYYLTTSRGPVEEAVLEDPLALAGRLHELDHAARKKGERMGVVNALASFKAAPAFGSLSSADRHLAYALDADLAFEAYHWQRARDSIRQATELPENTASDWDYLVRGDANVGDYADAARPPIERARRWPDGLEGLTARRASAILNGVKPLAGDAWFNLADILSGSPWARGPEGQHLSWTWRRLAEQWIERGNMARAATLLPLVRDPYAIISIRADLRFDPISSNLPGVDEALEDELERLRQYWKDNKRSLAAANDVVIFFLQTLRYDDALAFADDILKRSADEFDDGGSQRPWMLDYRARALWGLKRIDEALAQWTQAARARAEGRVNLSQAINAGLAFCDVARPRDALDAIALVDPAELSPWGWMELHHVRQCAALALNDRSAAETATSYLREHQADAPPVYGDALVLAGSIDEAARQLCERLVSPETRAAALLAVQDFAPTPALARNPAWVANWQRILQREDVRSAIAKVGRAGTYSVGPPLN